MHFEVDHELKAHWKAFFALLPRKSETRILTELMRNFLEKAKADYKDSVLGGTSNKEEEHDPRKVEVDQPGNREAVHDEPRVAGPEHRLPDGGETDSDPEGRRTQS
jgi:hypothetical protein